MRSKAKEEVSHSLSEAAGETPAKPQNTQHVFQVSVLDLQGLIRID